MSTIVYQKFLNQIIQLSDAISYSIYWNHPWTLSTAPKTYVILPDILLVDISTSTTASMLTLALKCMLPSASFDTLALNDNCYEHQAIVRAWHSCGHTIKCSNPLRQPYKLADSYTFSIISINRYMIDTALYVD